MKSPVAGFIDKFDPSIATLVRSGRAVLRKRWPTAFELVYDNYNALAIGFGSTERVGDIFVSLAVYPRVVNLYFFYGATLPDPQHVLQGGGTRGRFIPLENAAMLAKPVVNALLRAAVAHGTVPLPLSGRGRTVIKSVSAKQRPRRPASR